MGIIFKNLNWKVNGFSLHNTFVSHDASVIALNDPTSESLLGFNSNDWTVSELIADNQHPGIHYVDVSTALYKTCRKGCVFRFMKINQNDAIFGSDSSVTELCSWTKISEPLGNVLKIAGTGKGFAAIVNTEEFFYLKLFTITDLVTLQATALLPICSKIETNWLISRVDFRKLIPEFVRHFFREVSLVLTDLVLVSCPNGFVLLYAVMNDVKFSEPVPIFWDNEVVASVDVTPCGRGVVLFFRSGKIVFVVMRQSGIKYSVHYLSSSVTAATVVNSGAQFHIIWSDSVKLFYSGPTNLDNLLIQDIETPLKGIITLSVIGSSVLAGNINKTFYRISFDTAEGIATTVSLKTLTDIGTEVDRLRNELQGVNNHFNAVQADGSEIMTKVSGRELSLENLSTHTFSKNIWQLEIESSLNNIQFVKRFRFDDDFRPKSVIKFPLTDSLTGTLAVRMTGHVNKKLLVLSLCSVIVPQSENVFHELKNMLK